MQYPLISCPRRNLNPCDYTDMEEYSKEVACELTKLANSCGAQAIPQGCTSNITRCIKNLDYSYPPFQNLVPNGNPWNYCGQSFCGEHYCSNDEKLHFPISIAYQDKMLEYARGVANNIYLKPNCGEDYSAIPTEIIFKSCIVVNFSCFNEPQPGQLCHNIEIRLQVRYSCCPAYQSF